MKNIFFLLLLVIFVMSCSKSKTDYSKLVQNYKNLSDKDIKEKLFAGNWDTGVLGVNYDVITFKANSYGYESIGWEEITSSNGTYYLKNKMIYLNEKHKKSKKSHETIYANWKNVTCKIKPVPESLFYFEQLVCRGKENGEKLHVSFWNRNVLAHAKKEITIDGIKSITISPSIYKVIDAVKIRSKPSVKSKVLSYSELKGKNSTELKTYKYIPKGKEIVVLAKTRKKYKIGKWSNYWYYITKFKWFSPDRGFPSPIFKKKAWVYGEFVQFKRIINKNDKKSRN